MGLKREVFHSIVAKRRFFALALTTLFMAGLCGGNVSAEAVITNGVFTDDATNIRWEWVLSNDAEKTGEPQKVTIKFYDKPENLATVTVPSLSTVLSKVPGANSTLNTYYLADGLVASQDANYPDLTRREATTDTTKLDMTNTSKIQIIGVKPIINPEVETELVFGQNMVISDKLDRKYYVNICGRMQYNSYYDRYYCQNMVKEYFTPSGLDPLSGAEYDDYIPTDADVPSGYVDYSTANAANYSINTTYYSGPSYESGYVGAFAGYKLKLTNFSANNFNYVGWEAFANTQISGKSVTISGASFAGGDIFKGSDVENVTIETETIGAGIFRNCLKLKNITFADSVTRVTDDAFAGAGVGYYDFSTTNIKTIGPRAFQGAHMGAVKLDGVERIEYMAFADNNFYELTLPKSINYLQAYLFKNNGNLKKLTIAYDTLTSGTTLPMFVVLDGSWGASPTSGQPSGSLEEVNIIAPYREDEEVSATHVPYEDYKWKYDAYTQAYLPQCPHRVAYGNCNGNAAAGNDYVHAQYGAWESYYYSNSSYSARQYYRGSGSDYEWQYAHVDTYKNVLAPIYFHNLQNLHRITLGEGYEFIGSMAFYQNDNFSYMGGGAPKLDLENRGHQLNLPESLRGIGNGAFFGKFQEKIDFTIPKNIEFIGINAFLNTFGYDKDVDFPNLVALGDHAFEKTRTKNIHLYDKLQYMGAQVFSDCWFLNDITFDLDVFNPDIYIAWALPHRHGPAWYDSQFHLTTEFGPRYPYNLSNAQIAKHGIKVETRDTSRSNLWPLKFGKITFTDKNKSQLPNGYHNCYYFTYSDNPTASSSCPGGGYGTGIYNTFFGHVNAEKIDLGGADWKVLSARMFVQTYVDEVILPHALEVIPGDTFSDAFMTKELVLPDTIKVIGDAAFDYGQVYYGRAGNEAGIAWLKSRTAKITKLPASLEYLGNDAFYGDINLTADLNSPNLWYVGYKAFWGTHLRDTYLPSSIKVLGAASFANIESLRDITIDFDFGALPPNYETFDPSYFPQSFRDYAGSNLYQMVHMSCSARNMANSRDYPVTGFYSLFNQRIEYNELNGTVIYGQKKAHNHFGKVTFTENAKTDIWMLNTTNDFNGTGYFAGMEFDELDMSAAGFKNIISAPFAFEDTKIGTLKLPAGLEKIGTGMFENAEITNPFELPDTVKEIGVSAFQWAKGTIINMLPDSVESIQPSAFYGADLTDNLVVPGSVQLVGSSSFNAGDRDVHYDTVKFEANVTNNTAHGQLIHQMFWNADIDKLRVDSMMLAGIDQGRGDAPGNQEFWNMSIKEAEITNLPRITRGAFEKCAKLEKVDLSKDANLRRIGDEAFMDATSLHIIDFSPAIKDEYVEIGQYAFKNTAFESIGKAGKDININAAKFNAFDGLAFAEMPNLKTVDVPNSFSNGTIPAATFLNDTELEEASVDYKIKLMDNAAFGNDNKLERIFIWGNTAIVDENLPGYIAPATGGMGSVTDLEGIESGPTIPEDTDIYAYSSWNAEPYAGSESRDEFDGVFYPLDEVLYITTNKTHVKVNDNETDFDKSGMIVYGLRRDGVVLESDSWGDFNNNVYRRSEKDLNFAKMIPAVMENPAFATVWDTPVPVNELSYENENFKDIDFELVDDEDGVAGVKRINIIYTDAYTGGEPDTDVLPIGDNIPVLPRTVDDIAKAVSVFGILALVGAATLVVSRRAFHRR